MMSRRAPVWLAAIGLVALVALFGPAKAEEEGTLRIELNQLENVEQGCRGTVIFTNGLDVTVRELAIEVAVFDQDDHVMNLWLLPARNMTPGAVRVRQFLFQDDFCDDIGQILLNDVVNCEGNGLEPEQCLRMIEASSRTEVPFISTVGGN